MANGMAMIDEGLWRKNRDFQRLPRLAQCTFVQVLSQKDLDTCGVLTLHLELLAKACNELTIEQLKDDLAVLERARFLFVDYDTDELLVRSYVRLVSAKTGAKGKSLSWHSVPKNARLLGSVKLRHELAVELRRIRWKEADEIADEIDPTPSEPSSKPLESPSQKESPFEGSSKPHSKEQVQVLVSPNVVGSVGVPPRPNCADHEENSDTDCRACMRRRIWDEKYLPQIEADELQRKRDRRAAATAALRRCRLCDEEGWVLGPDGTPAEPGVKCTAHQEEAHA